MITVWRWAHPYYFSWLILVPILYFMAQYWGKQKYKKLKSSFGDKILPFLMSGISSKKFHFKLFLLLVAFIPLILSLARPQFGESKENIKSSGVELMILFDVSQSMLAEDVSPSRLSFAKSEVLRFLDKIPGSKVGLVAFAGSAALISPITTDTMALKMFVESITTEAISTQGTEFKMALEQAEASFQRGGQGDNPDIKVTRVILIISDGEDQEPGAIEAAENLVNKGIRIFSVAVGTEKGGSIPLRDNNGFLRGYKKDSNGQVVNTTSKGDSLKSLAQAGKGSFYTASFAGAYLDQLVEDINKLEKTEFDTQSVVSYQERYQIFLLIGIIIIFLEMMIKTTINNGTIWRGRFMVKK